MVCLVLIEKLHRGGCVVQRSEQILFHVADRAAVLCKALQHKADMVGVQLHKAAAYHLGGFIVSGGAQHLAVGGRQVQRFIRLTNLIPELLNMVDEKKVSFNPAVELSYLSTEQQQEMINAMDDTQNAPSFSQAKRIKKLAQEGNFTSEAVVDIMGEEKKSELDTVTIKNEILRKYFPRSYTPKQMEEKIIQLLDAWQRKQQRQNER